MTRACNQKASCALALLGDHDKEVGSLTAVASGRQLRDTSCLLRTEDIRLDERKRQRRGYHAMTGLTTLPLFESASACSIFSGLYVLTSCG